MIRTRCLRVYICASILLHPHTAGGQQDLPKFEVASVKPWSGGGPVIRGPGVYATVSITDRRVAILGAPLKQIIQIAFNVRPYQITGPEWMATTRLEVQATIPESVDKKRVPEMLQALLAERFGLVAHRAASLQPVYGLVVSKGGIKFATAKVATDESGANIKVLGDGQGVTGGVSNRGDFGPFTLSMSDGMMHFEFTQITLNDFAKFLSQGQVGLPVVDMTGLNGNYDIKLGVSVGDVGAAAGIRTSADDPAVPTAAAGSSFFSGLEKLGLRLESTKAPIELVVVDHVERVPTSN